MALLRRVLDGLRSLPTDPDPEPDYEPECRPEPRSAVESGCPLPSRSADLSAELAPLARRLWVSRPEVWAPCEVNEPSPDAVRTVELPVVEVPR